MESNVRPKKKFYKKWWFWVIVIILIIGFGAGGSNSKDTKTASSNTTTNQSTDAKKQETTNEDVKVAKIGDTVEVGNFTYKVIEVKNKKKIGNEYLNKETDANYLLVRLSAKNISKESRTLDSNMFKIVTADGTEYSADATLGMYLGDTEAKFFLNQVNPGIKVDGTLIFEVPKKSTEEKYTLVLSGGFASAKETKIELFK